MTMTAAPVAVRGGGLECGEQVGLRALLSPASVAVVGAMQRHGSAGFEMVRALRDFGYRGRLYPVNGSGRPVLGVPGYRTIADLPQPVDLLVIAAPADHVPQVLREAGRRGVRSAVVLTRTRAAAGSPDRPPGTWAWRIAGEYGMRVLGPDSLGVINTDARVQLNASLSPVAPRSGGLALVTRSAAVGIAVLEHAARNGCGLAAFVSLGDNAEVSGADLITHWHTDPHVRAFRRTAARYRSRPAPPVRSWWPGRRPRVRVRSSSASTDPRPRSRRSISPSTPPYDAGRSWSSCERPHPIRTKTPGSRRNFALWSLCGRTRIISRLVSSWRTASRRRSWSPRRRGPAS
jgi:predicted CoA-binding protein